MLSKLLTPRVGATYLKSSGRVGRPGLLGALAPAGSRGRSSPSKPPTDLPSELDTLIVGGGVVGTAILHQLGVHGVGASSAIFEKAELTSGATWHAAGLVTYYHGGNNFKFWHQEGCDLFKKWQNEEGIELSFNQPGSIRLIQNADRMKEALYTKSKSKLYQELFGGPELHLITPEEVKRLHPLVNTDGLEAALYTEGDGHICPSSVTQAFAKKARELGGRVYRQTAVTNMTSMPDGTWEVEVTPTGGEPHVVRARRVINCAGLWCPKLGEIAGIHTPGVVLQHQYVITEPIPEVKAYHEKHGHQLPVLRDLEGSYYLRDEGDGMLIGPYEDEHLVQVGPAEWKGSMPEELTYYLFDGDLDRLMHSMEYASHLVPQVATTGIKTVLNGPTCWPADGAHLVGPAYEKPNYWHACAESYGIAHSAGLARYIVSWMQNGEPPYELNEADPTRYGNWATTEWTNAKVKEAYGWNNKCVYPNNNMPAARPVIHPERPQADIYKVLQKRGAQFGFSHGWENPSWFNSDASSWVDLKNSMASFERPAYTPNLVNECKQVVDHGGLCYWPFAHYRITGPDAASFLNRMIANKLPATGRIGLGHLLTPTGKVYSEQTFVRIAEDDFYVTGYAGFQLHDLRWFRQHLGKDENVNIDDVTSSRALILCNGPNADAAVAKLLDEPVDLDRKVFKPFQFRHLKLAGIDTIACRMAFIGEHGLELHVPRDRVAELYEKLQEADPKMGNWGGNAMNSFRLEKGVRLFGKDFTKDHNAYEAGLDRFIKMDKGDFIGRDALQKVVDAGGADRMTVHYEIKVGDANVDSVGNESIYCPQSGKVIGFTTSGSWGCLTNKSMGLGYVSGKERFADGTHLHIELYGKKYDAYVQSHPAMDMAAVRDRKAATSLTGPQHSAMQLPAPTQERPHQQSSLSMQ